MRLPRRHRIALVVGAAVLLLAAGAGLGLTATGGRGGGRPPTATPTPIGSPPTSAVRSGVAPPTAGLVAAPSPRWTLVATTDGAIPRYPAARASRPDGTIPARWYGGVSALPVIAQQPGWLRVRLASRPNGSTAWVRRADVRVTSTPYRVVVNLTARRLELYRLGRRIMDVPAGVGTSADPTPTGQFFVAFFEKSPNAGYGPFILVTSAHSDVIRDWDGSGDAVIGIHGPLGASSLIGSTGAYLSHGCVRILVRYLDRLRDVPAGSPVTIAGHGHQ